MLRKGLMMLLAGVMSISLMACGGGGNNVSDNSTSENITSGDKGEEGNNEISGELTVFGWGGGEELAVRKKATKIFQELYPKVKVKEIWLPASDVDKKLDAALAAGNAGDVIMMSPDWYGLRSKWFEDLTPYMEKSNINPDEVFTDGANDGYVVDGKCEGMPATFSDFVIVYNKDIFDKAGIPYPTDDWTWDEFVEKCNSVASGEGVNRIYGLSSHWILPSLAMVAYGGRPYNENWTTQTVDDENVIKGIQMFGDLMHVTKSIPDDAASKSMPSDQMFTSGKSAMYTMGIFEAEQILSKVGENFNLGTVLLPKDPSGNNVNVKFATGFAMNKDSKNKEAAWAYIETISTNKEVAELYCKVGVPAAKSAEETFKATTLVDGKIQFDKYLEGFSHAILNPWGGALSKAGDQYTQLWEQVTISNKLADEAAKEYAPKIQQGLDDINSKRN